MNTPESQPRSSGEIIAKMMNNRGWTQKDLAGVLNKPQPEVSQLITSKRSITPETAHLLAQAFGNSALFWMETEARYRVSLVTSRGEDVRDRARLYDLAPIKDMEKRGWINKADSLNDTVSELKRFFSTDDLDSIPDLCVHTKKTDRTCFLTPEQRAWCFRAKELSISLRTKRYSKHQFEKGIKRLQELAAWPEHARQVTRVLGDMGIKLVIIEPLPRTKIDGATFWLDEDSPVIALSLRYDRIDSFWHTLGHELSHVYHKDGLTLDSNLVGENRPSPVELDATERRADREAAELVIKQNEIEDFIIRVGPLYSRTRINQFANKIKIHPGIIIGQLQYRGEISYSSLRDTLVKVRESVASEAITDGWGYCVTNESN